MVFQEVLPGGLFAEHLGFFNELSPSTGCFHVLPKFRVPETIGFPTEIRSAPVEEPPNFCKVRRHQRPLLQQKLLTAGGKVPPPVRDGSGARCAAIRGVSTAALA